MESSKVLTTSLKFSKEVDKSSDSSSSSPFLKSSHISNIGCIIFFVKYSKCVSKSCNILPVYVSLFSLKPRLDIYKGIVLASGFSGFAPTITSSLLF